MTWEEFKKTCIDAGFQETKNEGSSTAPFIYYLGDEYDSEIADSPPCIYFENFANKQGFVFSSGLAGEFVHLNTMDPKAVVEWGKLISHIEPNF